jgi:hypothetical protein
MSASAASPSSQRAIPGGRPCGDHSAPGRVSFEQDIETGFV